MTSYQSQTIFMFSLYVPRHVSRHVPRHVPRHISYHITHHITHHIYLSTKCKKVMQKSNAKGGKISIFSPLGAKLGS